MFVLVAKRTENSNTSVSRTMFEIVAAMIVEQVISLLQDRFDDQFTNLSNESPKSRKDFLVFWENCFCLK